MYPRNQIAAFFAVFSFSVAGIFVSFSTIAGEAPPDIDPQQTTNSGKASRHRAMLDDYLESVLADEERVPTDSLLILLKDGYQQFVLSDNTLGQAEMLLRMGRIYIYQSMFTVAADVLEESGELFGLLEDHHARMAAVHNDLGKALGRKGDYKAAAVHLIKAMNIYEEIGNQEGLSLSLIRLGTVNGYLDNTDLALHYFERALPIALEFDKDNVITIYSNLGAVYVELGDLEKGKEYFQLALNYERNNDRTRTLALIHLGQLYKSQGEPVLAEQHFDEAMQLAETHRLYEEMMVIGINRIDTTSSVGLASALKELSRLKTQADTLEMKYMQYELSTALVNVNKKLGDFEQAFEWMVQRDHIQSQLYNERKTRDIANLQAAYDLEKSKKEISVLNEQVVAGNRERLMILIFSFFLVAGFLLSLYFFFRGKQAYRRLREREQELSMSNRVKDKLFSVIGHDLKNAINSQLLALRLLEEGDVPETERIDLQAGLQASVHEALFVLDTLLHWGKMQIKGVIVNQMVFDAGAQVQATVKLLELSVRMKDITISNEIPIGTGVLMDMDHFNFVVRNLLSNAIKYSLRGGRVEIGIADPESSSDRIVFYVQDWGVGIENKELDTVFESFSTSVQGTENEIGSGIALMLSKEFVNRNKGEIWVESTPGEGAIFYFSVPSRR